jgi:maltose alpha-D-glucosyltransferase/alpha-amylase
MVATINVTVGVAIHILYMKSYEIKTGFKIACANEPGIKNLANTPIHMARKKSILFIFAIVFVFIIAFVLTRKHSNDEVQKQVTSADSSEMLWYKNSIIYTLDVEVFKDSDGDGIGDFKGLSSRLGYIDSLGADVIWLAPFQPTPNGDDGYDISDFYKIDERLGTFEDFNAFMEDAKERKIKVLMDLVLNHTSSESEWFQSARKSPTSPYRNWYVWSKEKPDNYDVGMVFPGVQKSIWDYDSSAGEYYYHRFYDFQPDLNTQNPDVVNEMNKIVKFWIDKGLNGFRLDAVPFYIEKPETKGDEFEHDFKMLTSMRSYLKSLDEDAIILGEANVTPEENKDFFGERGDGIHMMFNFFVNQHLFYALATADVEPLQDALEQTKGIPVNAEWGQFLRNHDEVDLGRLTDKQRNKVYAAFGPDKSMQLYDRGIRRRLAPMLKNNRAQLELSYSLLLALPSTPVLRYGDELGMGDDLRLKERLSVRTPMQWNGQTNAGFSSAAKPVRPVINSPAFPLRELNVKTQQADSSSMLQWTKRMVKLRKGSPEIGFGSWSIIDTQSSHLLALYYTWKEKELLIVHNLSNDAEEVSIKLPGGHNTKMVDLLSLESISPVDEKVTFKIDGYGYRWLRRK